MKIAEVKNLVEQIDSTVGFFVGLDKQVQLDGLELEIIKVVNRMICSVLGLAPKDESSLKSIAEVKLMTKKLGGLIGLAEIAREDEMMDETFEQAFIDRVERYLRNVLEIRVEVKTKVKQAAAVDTYPEVDIASLTSKQILLFEFFRRRLGQPIALAENKQEMNKAGINTTGISLVVSSLRERLDGTKYELVMERLMGHRGKTVHTLFDRAEKKAKYDEAFAAAKERNVEDEIKQFGLNSHEARFFRIFKAGLGQNVSANLHGTDCNFVFLKRKIQSFYKIVFWWENERVSSVPCYKMEPVV